jgi:hypothetical protein
MPRPGELEWLAIRHVPWALQDARVELVEQAVTGASGLPLQRAPDHVAFNRSVDVVAWRRRRR